MSPTKFSITAGVDIAKKKFDVASLADGGHKHKTFGNNGLGHIAFIAWFLPLCGDIRPLVRMEATGAHGLPPPAFLVNQGCPVSLPNPARIRAFAKSGLGRAKTDKADAKLVARYAFIMRPPVGPPPPANIRESQALARRAGHLLETARMERSRQGAASAKVVDPINTVLETLEAGLEATHKAIQDHIDNSPDLKQRSDSLCAIPGVGHASAAHLLVALGGRHGFGHAKQVVAFAGLAPALRQSGRRPGNTHIAKNGDALLRKALCMPALCALRLNPLIRTFSERLKANGKNGKAVACAAMRKLVHTAFGVLESGKAFDPYAA